MFVLILHRRLSQQYAAGCEQCFRRHDWPAPQQKLANGNCFPRGNELIGFCQQFEMISAKACVSFSRLFLELLRGKRHFESQICQIIDRCCQFSLPTDSSMSSTDHMHIRSEQHRFFRSRCRGCSISRFHSAWNPADRGRQLLSEAEILKQTFRRTVIR